jgi:nicotinamidase-related amidase
MTDQTKTRTALICVDVQHDFLPGGALAVPAGDEVVEPLVELAPTVDVVVASADYHPHDHMSFADNGGIWPVHCVGGTRGAEIHPAIAAIADVVVRKATETETDAYSAFQGTGLAEILRQRGVERVLVGGLATDYCVKATVLDAIASGFETELVAEAARAVNVNEGDEAAAVAEMIAAGATAAAPLEV